MLVDNKLSEVVSNVCNVGLPQGLILGFSFLACVYKGFT